MSEMKQRAEHVRKKKAAFGPDVNLAGFTHQGGAREYDPDYRRFSPEERSRLLTTGIELTDEDHAELGIAAAMSAPAGHRPYQRHYTLTRPELAAYWIVQAADILEQEDR